MKLLGEVLLGHIGWKLGSVGAKPLREVFVNGVAGFLLLVLLNYFTGQFSYLLLAPKSFQMLPRVVYCTTRSLAVTATSYSLGTPFVHVISAIGRRILKAVQLGRLKRG